MSRAVSNALSVVMFVSGTIAVWSMDQNVFWVAATFKPVTTLLLFVALGKVNTALQRRIALGLGFALIGDIALLGQEGFWFQAGLAAFLVTHALYITAFLPFAVPRWRTLLVATLGIGGSVGTVTMAYPEAAKAGVALPVAVYAAAITGTLVVTSATVGGRLAKPALAAIGAALFYVADTCIAISVFVPSIELPHPPVFTTGVYWVGQYCIAVAARFGIAQSPKLSVGAPLNSLKRN